MTQRIHLQIFPSMTITSSTGTFARGEKIVGTSSGS